MSDTSCISALLTIEEAQLLPQLFLRVLIPLAVQRELLRHHPQLPAFLEAQDIRDRERVERLMTELDKGESEAIVLASELHADFLLMDDQPGRKVALREGLRVVGLVGVLLLAKDRQLISSVREFVARLEGDRVSLG